MSTKALLAHVRELPKGEVCTVCHGEWANVCSGCMGSGRQLTYSFIDEWVRRLPGLVKLSTERTCPVRTIPGLYGGPPSKCSACNGTGTATVPSLPLLRLVNVGSRVACEHELKRMANESMPMFNKDQVESMADDVMAPALKAIEAAERHALEPCSETLDAWAKTLDDMSHTMAPFPWIAWPLSSFRGHPKAELTREEYLVSRLHAAILVAEVPVLAQRLEGEIASEAWKKEL